MLRSFSQIFLLMALAGCRTAAPLPQVNLAEPGWQVRQGQAVWQPNRQAPEIAGELLVATRDEGSAFVQFTKNPFTLVIARTSPAAWQIQFAQAGKMYSGRGSPPSSLTWLQFARWVNSATPAANYLATHPDTARWRLENKSTGESVEAYFNP